MDKFGVDALFTPERPVCSAKGAVVTNIAHIPAALTAVMAANGIQPDFAPEGSMELKPWFGSNAGIVLPPELDLPVVAAVAPYDRQIKALESQVGATFPREAMKDASGVSQMDPKTQVTRVNGVSVLDAAQYPIEANVGLALLKEPGGENDRKLVSVAVGAFVNLHGERHAGRGAGRARGRQRAQRRAGRGGGAGRAAPARAARARRSRRWSTASPAAGAARRAGRGLRPRRAARRRAQRPTRCCSTPRPDPRAAGHARRAAARGAQVGVPALPRGAGRPPERRRACWPRSRTTLAWGPLMRKRISRLTVESLPAWCQLFGTLIGASVDAARHEPTRFVRRGRRPTMLGRLSLTEVAYAALLGQRAGRDRALRLPDAGRPAAVQRPGHHHRAGRQGRGVVRRPRAAAARAAQQGDARLPQPLRLRARRQRLRGRGLPARAVPRRRPARPRPRRPRHRPEGAGGALRRRVRALQEREEEPGQPGPAEDPLRQPPGVQGQAGQPRPARGVRPRADAASAASTTSSSTTTTRWCSSSSRRASRATSTASTSTR